MPVEHWSCYHVLDCCLASETWSLTLEMPNNSLEEEAWTTLLVASPQKLLIMQLITVTALRLLYRVRVLTSGEGTEEIPQQWKLLLTAPFFAHIDHFDTFQVADALH